jgi:hypothetical protein
MDEHLQIGETQDSVSCGEYDKGIGRGQIRPSGRQRTEAPRGRVVEEDARLPPGEPLGYEEKLLSRKGMEGMGAPRPQPTLAARPREPAQTSAMAA